MENKTSNESKKSGNKLQPKRNTTKKQKENDTLVSRLLKHPGRPYYLSMPSPDIHESSPATKPEWEDGAEPITGFTEFRKYKKMNETRVITPYKPEETDERKLKSKESCIDLKMNDPQKFFLDNFNAIQISSLQSLLNLINSQPNLGYLTMNREHMDPVDNYDPYRYTILNYNDIDKSNYVTISSNGLIEFYKGDADFLPIERLLVEYKLLNTLKNIPTFKIFRLWKAFMVWLNRARLRRFIEAKEKMEVFFSEKYGAKGEMED